MVLGYWEDAPQGGLNQAFLLLREALLPLTQPLFACLEFLGPPLTAWGALSCVGNALWVSKELPEVLPQHGTLQDIRGWFRQCGYRVALT